jgi:peptidyl-prolyl cis-trans isomerase C
MPLIGTFSLRFSKIPAYLGLIVLTSLMVAPAGVQAKVLAKVEGIEISDEDLQIALDDIGATLPPDLQGPAKENYLIDYLIDLKLVARQAEADKTMDPKDFARRLAYYKDKVLMEGAFGILGKKTGTEDSLRKVYDEVSKTQKGQQEIHASHILVETQDLAQTALKRLKAGEDFAKVATDMSNDPGSVGGDLGWFTKDRMVPEFGEAAFKLNIGQISEPVQSQFGWHVIKLLEKREKPFPPFEAVRDQVARYALEKAQSEEITRLRKGAKIERMEPELTPGQLMQGQPAPKRP